MRAVEDPAQIVQRKLIQYHQHQETMTNMNLALVTVRSPPLSPKKQKVIKKFSDRWKDSRPWLVYCGEKNTMYCQWCRDFTTLDSAFREGTSNFRLSSITKHEVSEPNKKAVGVFKVRQLEGTRTNAPIEQGFINVEREQIKKIEKLFRTAYYLAIAERPFSDFPSLCTLQELNEVELGSAYKNDKQAYTFLHFIAEVQREELKSLVDRSVLFSLLIDSATDVAIIDEEILYLHLIEEGRPVTKYFSLQALNRANSEGILKSIDTAFNDELGIENWKERIVGFGADGAAVNFGKNQGVSARLSRDVPSLIGVHCVAHRMELAIKHSLKACQYFKDVEVFLMNIFKFYKNSPLNWTNLQEAGAAANQRVYRLSNVQGTRWIGHHERALDNVTKNYVALVTHLDQISINRQSSDAENKARGFVRLLKSYRFIKSLYVLLDIYRVLSRLSLMFQKNDSSVETVESCLRAAIGDLGELRDNPGPREVEFNGKITVSGDIITFEGLQCNTAERGKSTTQARMRYDSEQR
ncbi:zinc finger protein 862-like [Ptychodera flava]|uniref:zinc finger protein 862-like n=1 Tax=Ptychodera flava TaxID=63121 RepID=UPI003969BDC9